MYSGRFACLFWLLNITLDRLAWWQGSECIKTKHNSNHKTQQITLEGEKIQEYIYYLLGFVPAAVIHLQKNAWFSQLSNEQITLVEKYLHESGINRF